MKMTPKEITYERRLLVIRSFPSMESKKIPPKIAANNRLHVNGPFDFIGHCMNIIKYYFLT